MKWFKKRKEIKYKESYPFKNNTFHNPRGYEKYLIAKMVIKEMVEEEMAGYNILQVQKSVSEAFEASNMLQIAHFSRRLGELKQTIYFKIINKLDEEFDFDYHTRLKSYVKNLIDENKESK